MTAHADRFTGRVEAYERFRNRFPESILSTIREISALQPDQVVADIGAGTGMLAELFLRHGNPVYAVEPNQEMRTACERLIPQFPSLRVINGTAEATTLPAARCDLVAVGRAFHWFDQVRAMAEFRRILKPGGWVVLVTTRWSGDGSEASRDFQHILNLHGTDFHKYVEGQLSSESLAVLFQSETLHSQAIHDRQSLSLEELIGRVASLSVSPRPGDPRHQDMQDALAKYFQRFQENGYLQFPVSYNLICGKPATPGV